MATVTGTNAGEPLVGTAGNDVIVGLGGADTLSGLGGDDVLSGGAGDDALDGGPGFDLAAFDDATSGVTVDLSLSGYQPVGGGLGSDRLAATEGLVGSAFGDRLTGDDRSNYLVGGQGGDTLSGAGGDDNLQGGAGDDELDGGDQSRFDYVTFNDATSGVTVDLRLTGFQPIGGGRGSDRLTGIEGVFGSIFGDRLTGNDGFNAIAGGSGDDTINGEGGEDILGGGPGDDLIDGGGNPSDVFDFAAYNDLSAGVKVSLAIAGPQDVGGGGGRDMLVNIEGLTGSYFNDTLTGNDQGNAFLGLGGDDIIDGGSGLDYISYYYATSGVTVTLGLSTPQAVGGDEGADILLSIEGVAGGFYNDTLTGDAQVNVFVDQGGDDRFTGSGGDDYIRGGSGADTAVYSGILANYAVDETADGGLLISDIRPGAPDGVDTLYGVETVEFSDGSVAIAGLAAPKASNGGGGADLVSGGLSADTLQGGAGSDTLYGGGGADSLSGGAGADVVYGGSSNDRLDGGAGSDSLSGEAGADTLTGGAGSDTLAGGAGDDVLEGGFGSDLFVFGAGGGADRVLGFGSGGDRIRLDDGITLADAADSGGDLVLTFSDGGSVVLAGLAGLSAGQVDGLFV